jgi:nucleotide-binding universal stress UspA family protein
MLPVHTILHPTDFSTHSQHAFRLAWALARDYGAQLIVMHVVPPGAEQFLALSELGAQERRENIHASFATELEKIRPPDPDIRVAHRLERGDTTSEVLRVANEVNADLIVMGTHGRTGLGRMLIGSIAEKVMRKATCPVLTVRMPFHENESETERAGTATRSLAGHS